MFYEMKLVCKRVEKTSIKNLKEKWRRKCSDDTDIIIIISEKKIAV